MRKKVIPLLATGLLSGLVCCSNSPKEIVEPGERRLDVGLALSKFPVAFSLVTDIDMQYVGYYDFYHQMTVASRPLDSDEWTYQQLPQKIGWDSHNYIAIAVDEEGYVHLSGNMHNVPLVYYRTARPHDITSFEEVHRMTGENENQVTYPNFMRGPDGALIFHYRDGGSGSGNEIYNRYDCASKSWKRLLDTPLVDGEGEMNAYMVGPQLGPDGYYHLVWVWRDTYHCETNHHLSYARSRDLLNWESAGGVSVPLPLTFDKTELWVDPIPVEGGIINGAAKPGWDSKNRLLISYHKFDEDGNTQAYVARYDGNGWNIVQITDWDYRWYFSGGGTIVFEIGINPPQPYREGVLRVNYNHVKYGSGYVLLDEETLRVLDSDAVQAAENRHDQAQTRSASALGRRRAWDSGDSSHTGRTFYLEWKCLPSNRDVEPTGVDFVPTMLQLVDIPDWMEIQ